MSGLPGGEVPILMGTCDYDVWRTPVGGHVGCVPLLYAHEDKLHPMAGPVVVVACVLYFPYEAHLWKRR